MKPYGFLGLVFACFSPVFGQTADTIRFETSESAQLSLRGDENTTVVLECGDSAPQTHVLSDIPLELSALPDQTPCKVYASGGKLTALRISGIKSLDVSEIETLQTLHCPGNQLTALDVSRNLALQELNCAQNRLSVLDVSANSDLQELNCSFNLLEQLNLSRNPQLYWLDCYNNQLTALDLRGNKKLQLIFCYNNRLDSLTADSLPKLQGLYCGNNRLKTLNVSNDTSLQWLECFNNNLSYLEVDNCPRLEYLHCADNRLDTLGIFNCSRLQCLYAANNALSLARNLAVTQWFDASFAHLDTAFWHYTSNQHLYLDPIRIDTLDLRPEAYFENTATQCNVYDEESKDTLRDGTDYTFSEGFLIFKRSGNYRVQLQNSGILTHCHTPVYFAPFRQENTPISVSYHVSVELPALPDTCGIPVFEPKKDTVEKGTIIRISCATENAQIRYTLDGSTPTENSTLYTDGIAIQDSLVIKAMAMKDGWINSAVATARYIVREEIPGGDTLSNTTRPPRTVLSAYPNPCGATLHIKVQNGGEDAMHVFGLRLLDLQGNERLRVQGGAREIDMSQLPAGVYVLEATDGNGATVRHKIVKR
ncbi:MAG: chitobiase/beta-hexosaminidase C-terminal domain-containing protein [Bacteroides sp.]|nr:chitobiase/beta-hexosaminidase C-terminal domain-containing protein [Bacteroides sp.]